VLKRHSMPMDLLDLFATHPMLRWNAAPE